MEIRLSLLSIGDTMIGGVDGEVFNAIAQRFKRELPYKQTMMATLTNGMARSGYIPGRGVVREPDVRGAVVASAARLCRIGHCQRHPVA